MIYILIPAILLFLYLAFYNGLVIRNYQIHSNKVKQELRFVVVSDLHSSRYGKNQSEIIGKIRKLNPDCILLPGDIVDDRKEEKDAYDFLRKLPEIAPTYYVTGNHENIQKQVGAIKHKIKSLGITVLSYQSSLLIMKGNPCMICGIEDPRKYNYHDISIEEENKKMISFEALKKESCYKILLAHRPEKQRVNQYLKYGFDLIIGGHAHGGQVRIPGWINGLYAPHQGGFPAFAGGFYAHKKQVQIVSRGASFFWKLPRIFNPPEVILIKIKPKE